MTVKATMVTPTGTMFHEFDSAARAIADVTVPLVADLGWGFFPDDDVMAQVVTGEVQLAELDGLLPLVLKPRPLFAPVPAELDGAYVRIEAV